MKRLMVIHVMMFITGLLSQPAAAIEIDEARHLLSRTGFGGDWEQIQSIKSMGYKEAVEFIIEKSSTRPLASPPEWVEEPLISRRQVKQMSEEERKKLRKQMRQRGFELKAWWMGEMIQTDSPATERMTLFWHNHFTSSFRKVKSPKLMYAQNRLLREHSLGNFRQMIHAVAKDPAMIIYLDNAFNRKGKPNENFARELLELFTLGEGNYTEKDIKEAARAFTGWTINRNTGKFRFARRQHDYGTKTFMGRSGNFDGNDIIDIVLAQQRVAEYITEKLWREFVSETADPKEINRLAEEFRKNNYEIKPLMHAMLTSKTFRDPKNRGTMIKSPVDLIVGTMRMFDVPMGDGRGIVLASRRLGQDILDPPNVKGWPGGNSWITSDTLLIRRQIMDRFLRGMEMRPKGEKSKGSRAMMMSGSMVESPLFGTSLTDGTVLKVLLPLPPVESVEGISDRRELISELVQDPVFQLK